MSGDNYLSKKRSSRDIQNVYIVRAKNGNNKLVLGLRINKTDIPQLLDELNQPTLPR